MSIFRRDEPVPGATLPSSSPASSKSPSAPPEKKGSPRGGRNTTHIADGSKVTGQIDGTSDLVIDGTVEGEIKLESDVSVGSGGKVKGDVEARSVRIGGRVVGNVRGRDRVEILASGRLEGDVLAPRVVLAEGAFFKGKVEMTGSGGLGKDRAPEGRR